MIPHRPLPVFEKPVEALFGQNVFNEPTMRENLPKPVFDRLRKTIRKGMPLDVPLAEAVAKGMKEWALANGATHYTHWFQPMTGKTAEKPDRFIGFDAKGEVITAFSGKMLMTGEPDASSFPSGGIRSTFEARGYTAWDPTSPAFILERAGTRTLCIPSLFFSYTGEILDRKIPLMKSAELVSAHACRILRLFGQEEAAAYVDVSLGVEQEYFLVDRALFEQRPDLMLCGRTLYGAPHVKGQELGDHYFGMIPARVLGFMAALERRLLALGIPVKTRHNEVAPGQFELAQLYETANLASDHNMLTMGVLKDTAEEFGFFCLLHEKPFAGVNGSGKHNNWSLADALGRNLLEPGETPEENAQFLVFLAAVLKAVHEHAVALRIGVACAGNDHRLGAHEAPPAIISVFLGEQLTDIVTNIIAGSKSVKKHGGALKIGLSRMPPLPKDTSDRNRTAPFAFTGNKFEFRAVGSSQAVAQAVIALNQAAAVALDEIAGTLEEAVGKGRTLAEALQALLPKLFKAHLPVVFNGDCYTPAWRKEAAARGLPDLTETAAALLEMGRGDTLELLTKFDLFTAREVAARQEILLDTYAKAVALEAAVTLGMGRSLIMPAAVSAMTAVSEHVAAMKKADVFALAPQKELLVRINALFQDLYAALARLETAIARAQKHASKESAAERAVRVRDTLIPAMRECRAAADALELLVPTALWPVPRYEKLLWIG